MRFTQSSAFAGIRTRLVALWLEPRCFHTHDPLPHIRRKTLDQSAVKTRRRIAPLITMSGDRVTRYIADRREQPDTSIGVSDHDDHPGVALEQVRRRCDERFLRCAEWELADGRARSPRAPSSSHRPVAARRRRRGGRPSPSWRPSARRARRSPPPAANRSAPCGRRARGLGNRRAPAQMLWVSRSVRQLPSGHPGLRARRATTSGRPRHRHHSR